MREEKLSLETESISGFPFFNTSEYDLAELVNDFDHLAANFKSYIQGFSPNVSEILLSAEKGLDFLKQIDKMDKNNRLLSVVKAFSELDLDPRTIDNMKMGYIFEELIRKFSENAEAGDHYTGRDIIKLMVNILLAEGCDDIFDDGKVVTILDILLKSDKLKASAKNNTVQDFEFSYFDNIDDALIKGLDQNQDFFSLLLSNDNIKRQVLGIFTEEIYQSLREA